MGSAAGPPELFASAEALRMGLPDWPHHLALIDLAGCPAESAPPRLSGALTPVIGIGNRTHPWATALDAVVEPPISLESVLAQIALNPNAAACAVQLLRCTTGMDVASALVLESMCFGMLQGSEEHVRWFRSRSQAAPIPAGEVHVSRVGDEVLEIVLDRPLARNAIDRAMRDDLFSAFSIAVLDAGIRDVRVRALGSAFSMGGDLAEFGTTRDPAAAHAIRGRTLPAFPLSQCAEIVHVHVHGGCVGAGLELVAFAGRVTATENAWFQLPELSMGLIPGAGGTVSLPRRIGRQRAALLVLSGRRIPARVALQWGLVDAIEGVS